MIWRLRDMQAINDLFSRAGEAIDEYEKTSWWRRLFSKGRPCYRPNFMRDNPFPTPGASDLEKFAREYPQGPGVVTFCLV